MVTFPEREHGLGKPPEPTGPPTAKPAGPLSGVEPVCPLCGCAFVCEIIQPLEAPPLLKMVEGEEAQGRYLGCPACPWASAMLVMSMPKGGA